MNQLAPDTTHIEGVKVLPTPEQIKKGKYIVEDTELKGRKQVRNTAQTSLDFYRNRGYITSDQWAAGEKLYWMHSVVFGQPRTTHRYDAEAYGFTGDLEESEFRVLIEQAYFAAWNALDLSEQAIAQTIVIDGSRAIEAAQELYHKASEHYSRRCVQRLRDALDVLVKHFDNKRN